MRGAELVLEWIRKRCEYGDEPSLFEIRCQLEMAVDKDKEEDLDSYYESKEKDNE